MESIFRPVDGGLRASLPKFDFWSEPSKPKIIHKPKFNLRKFWIAALTALTMNTSVWAELGRIPVQSVQTNITQAVVRSEIFAVNRDFHGDAKNTFSIASPAVEFADDIRLHAGTSAKIKDLASQIYNGTPKSSEEKAVQPGPELAGSVASVIGENGIKRISEFARSLDGWDGRNSYALNPKSIQTLNRFFQGGGIEPSSVVMFMSRTGYLVVHWPLAHEFVELEFAEEGLNFYSGFDDSEYYVERNKFGDFKYSLKLLVEKHLRG